MRRVRPLHAVAATLAVCAGLAATLPVAAQAATANRLPIGRVEHVSLAGNRASLSGWAVDPDYPNTRVRIAVRVDGRLAAFLLTGRRRPDIAASQHVGVQTGWSTQVTLAAGRHSVCSYAEDARVTQFQRLGCSTLTVAQTANQAIAHLAARYVGARYVDGGASPRTGFDCSGFTQYVYATAAHISLVHYTETQFQRARTIARSRAVPGDLVFFHDASGFVYHVGIYAGGNMMWAAATPRDGVRYQTIWSSAVTFGTYTHR